MQYLILVFIALTVGAQAQQKVLSFSTLAEMAAKFSTNSLERTMIVTDGSGSFLYTPSATDATNSTTILKPVGGIGRLKIIPGGAGSGTVTSVAQTVPSFLSVAGSPITGSGTLAISLATQTSNTFFAGPTSGSAATPAFRAMVAADLPAITLSIIKQVPTLSDLVALASPSSFTNVYVQGRLTTNDGGGGLFSYAASSVTTNLGTVTATADGGSTRWVRQYSGPLNTLWFGVVADDSTDNTTALQDAIYVAERTANNIEFKTAGTVTNAIRTGNLYVTNKIGVSFFGNNVELKLIWNSGSLLPYSGLASTNLYKAAFTIANLTNGQTMQEISGFRFTGGSLTNDTAQTSGSIYGIVFGLADNYIVRRNTFEMPDGMGVGNYGGMNIYLVGNTFTNCGAQTGVGYHNHKRWGGALEPSVSFAANGSRGANRYRVLDNNFYGSSDRRFLFISGAADFIARGNTFDGVTAGNTSLKFGGTNAYLPVLHAYVGDIGWADVGGINGTNFTGLIEGNIIRGTFSEGINVSADETQASADGAPSTNRVNVAYLDSSVRIQNNLVYSTLTTTSAGIALYSAKKAIVIGNDVQTKASPFLSYGDGNDIDVINNSRLECLDVGTTQASTLVVAYNAFGNTRPAYGVRFRGNRIISGPNDEFFMRSATAYASDMRGMIWRDNEFIFRGTASGNGGPMPFIATEAAGTIEFSRNTFWLTNNVSGSTLLSLTAVSGTNQTALIFNDNKFIGISNTVPDIRGITATGFHEAQVNGNSIGRISLNNMARAMVANNRITASNASQQIVTATVTNLVVTGNQVRNHQSGSAVPIQMTDAASAVVSGNSIDFNSSSGPILLASSGVLTAGRNAVVNAGAGGVVPSVSGSATFDAFREQGTARFDGAVSFYGALSLLGSSTFSTAPIINVDATGATSAPKELLTLTASVAAHNAATNFGVRQRFKAERSSSVPADIFYIDSVWADSASPGSENSAVRFQLSSNSTMYPLFSWRYDGTFAGRNVDITNNLTTRALTGFLKGNGSSVVSASSTINLASEVTGTLPAANGGRTTNCYSVAVSDETTALTTGTAVKTFPWPFDATVTLVRAFVNTVSSSGLPTFDIKRNGTTVFSTKVTIDANEKDSKDAATPAVLSSTSWSSRDIMTVNIDVAGTGAKGATIDIYYTQ